MIMKKYRNVIVDLSNLQKHNSLYYRTKHDSPMPSVSELENLVELLKGVIFPGYFGDSFINNSNVEYFIGNSLYKAEKILKDQIRRGFCFECELDSNSCFDCSFSVDDITKNFITKLPEIKEKLSKDVIAAYNGDPAAKSYGETIFCYPSIYALTNYRIAHELLKLNVKLIPRIISELAHSKTGIEIHPAAEIGEYFFI